MSPARGLSVWVQARRMKHLLREGERVLAVAFISLRVRYADESETRELGPAVITLSTDAVYLQPRQNSEVTRIPYANITDLVERDIQTVIRTRTAHYVFISDPRAGNNLYDHLAAHMSELEVAQFKVEIDDAGVVLLTLRPIEENGAPVWIIHSFGDVDLTHPPTQQKIEAAIDPTILAEHPLPAWPDSVSNSQGE